MQIKLNRLNDKLAFQATNNQGNTIQIDANPSIGGENLGFRPMETLLASIASCASIDILLILKKKKIELTFYEIEISGERSENTPSPFEKINLTFFIGKQDPIDQVKKVVELSVSKYCSVVASLSENINLNWNIEQL